MNNKYCPHINMDKYDEWINNARNNLLKSKKYEDKFIEDYFRQLLRDNISFKKQSLKEHLFSCVGGIHCNGIAMNKLNNN
jgi:hypothetical protein